MYPDVVILRPNSPQDWKDLCQSFTDRQIASGNIKRKYCFSEVVIVASIHGVIIRRRATRFVCKSIGRFGYHYGNASTSLAREYASIIMLKSWLEPIGTAHIADKELIEGCKADLFFDWLVQMIKLVL